MTLKQSIMCLPRMLPEQADERIPKRYSAEDSVSGDT